MAGRPRKGFNVLGKKRRGELHQMENLKEEEIGQPVIGDDGHQIVDGGNQRAGSDGGIDMNLLKEDRDHRAGNAGEQHRRDERDADAARKVVNSVTIFSHATSLGGVESLIEHRASIEGPNTKTPQNLIRISVGLEHIDDLIADLEQALG